MKDKEIKFSIIVPVYNVEQYLEECLDSVTGQTYRNIEIILVDDGSTDNSPQICDRYADIDDRIVVIHKTNGGLSDARNAGIEIASGDYVSFVDSDDYIEPDAFASFEKCIADYKYPEVLITTLIYTYHDREEIEDSQIEEYFRTNGINKKSVIHWETDISNDVMPAVKKVYQLNFLNENHLRFCLGRIHEDVDWTTRLYYHANSFGICGNPWYHYRMNREGSVTSSVKVKNFIDVIEMGKYHFEYLERHNTETDKEVSRIYFMGLYNLLRHFYRLNQEDKETVLGCINNNMYLFAVKFAPDFKFKMFSCAIKIFGARNAFKQFFLLKTIKNTFQKA